MDEVDVTEIPVGEDRPGSEDGVELRAMLEAVVYVTDEPLTAQQIAKALGQPLDKIKKLLDELVEEFARPEHGLSIREVAGGYRMSTKAEHHEAVRAFVKSLTPPLKLSLAALETLAVVAYKQPVTAPEIMEIRGVQGAGVLKTLLDRKLIAESGRKNVVGKPILYKTTKDFLVQFGLKDLAELPTLKEFEELGRMELLEETPGQEGEAASQDAASGEAVAESSGDAATDKDASADKEAAADQDAATEEDAATDQDTAKADASEQDSAAQSDSVQDEAEPDGSASATAAAAGESAGDDAAASSEENPEAKPEETRDETREESGQ